MGFEERVHEMDQEQREMRRNLSEARDNENDAIRKARNAEDDLRRIKKRLEETEDELNEKLRKKEQRYEQMQEENTNLIGHHNKSQMTLMSLRNELEGAAERERQWRQKCRTIQEDLNRTKFALSTSNHSGGVYNKSNNGNNRFRDEDGNGGGGIDVDAFCEDFDVRLTNSKRGRNAYVNDIDYRASQDLRVSQGYGRSNLSSYGDGPYSKRNGVGSSSSSSSKHNIGGYSNHDNNNNKITPIRRQHGGKYNGRKNMNNNHRSVRFHDGEDDSNGYNYEKGGLRMSNLSDTTSHHHHDGQKVSALGHVGSLDYSPTSGGGGGENSSSIRRSVREEVESFVYDD